MISEVREIIYDCPFCDKEHEVEVIKEKSTMLIKGKKVEYDKVVYYCGEEDEEFCPSKIMDQNLLRARDSYRKSEGLLTSSEIKQIREKYKLTQKEYSNLLGWGDVTIQRYETKKIQDSTYDSIMRLTLENPSYCLNMLESNKNKFSEKRYNEIKNSIKDVIRMNGNEYLKQQEIKNQYIDFDNESELNGFKLLDIDKVNSVIGYFSNYISPLYKVKLMKLLWYADSLFYKLNNRSMTGLVYQHLPLGAVPVAYNQILELPSIEVKEEMHNDYIGYRICPKRDVNINEFTLEELKVLQEVASYFKDFNTKRIVDYMHDEEAYVKTEPDDIISYKFSSELKEFK